MLAKTEVTADILQDYLLGGLGESERRGVERAIRKDAEIARAFAMIRIGTDLLREGLQLPTEIPAEWLAIISRWDPSDA